MEHPNTEHFIDELADAQRRTLGGLMDAKNATVAEARAVASGVDGNVRRNAWSFIGGAALAGALLGLMFGYLMSRPSDDAPR